MQKILTRIFSVAVFLIVLALPAFATDRAVYVSAAAAGTGTGTAADPLPTLEAAFAQVGNGGTIYLIGTVPVQPNRGQCFAEPTHTAPITVTGAPGEDGALDLSALAHYHFGGNTEWRELRLLTDETVLSAEGWNVTLGTGITVSAADGGAGLRLTLGCVCKDANTGGTAVNGTLLVRSGEYESVSTWYGGAVTVKDTKAVLRLGAVRAGESVRVRTLCPGLLGATPAQPLRASATEIYVEIGDGVRVTRPYRFTQNVFSGSMTVNWLLGATAKVRASVFAPTDCYPAAGAVCKLKIFTAQEDASAKNCARLLQRGLPGYYTLQCADTDITNFCTVQGHAIRTMPDGRKICGLCGYEQCRHRTSADVVTIPATCKTPGEKRLQCTDLCKGYLSDPVTLPIDADHHAPYAIRTSYDPRYERYAFRCAGCLTLFSMQYGVPRTDVYVGANAEGAVTITDMATLTDSQFGALGTAELPFANFADAMNYAAVAAKQHGNATVHILDDAYVPSNYDTPTFAGTVTVTGGTLHFDGERRYFRMHGNMTFEHLTFRSNSDVDSVILAARNYRLVMGEGLIMGNDAVIPTEDGFAPCNSIKMYVIGGFIGPSEYQMNTNITIRSGDYWFVGGWNMNADTNNGKASVTLGKTNPDDTLKIFFFTPYSRGKGYITQRAEATVIVDGEVTVKRFYVTTLNAATQNVDYVTSVVLMGDIIGLNAAMPELQFDLRGCPEPFPQTVVNVYVDHRVPTAVADSYVFFGHPDGTFARDNALDRLDATVNAYSLGDFCTAKRGGHQDADTDGICDLCGSAQ